MYIYNIIYLRYIDLLTYVDYILDIFIIRPKTR
jgi:hypothetical protein